MLQMYLRCLEKLDRKQDFARVGLQLLANIAREQRLLSGFRSNSYLDEATKMQCLKSVIHASKSVQQPLSVPLADYFTQIQVDPYIYHFENRDGFRLSMHLRNLMSEEFEAQDVRVRIVGAEEEQNFEIWLATESPQHLKPGSNSITLSTTACSVFNK